MTDIWDTSAKLRPDKHDHPRVRISDDVVDHALDFCIALVYGRDVFSSWSNECPNICLWSLFLALFTLVIGPLTVTMLSVSSTVLDSANDGLRVASLPVIVGAVLGSLRKSCCSNLSIRRDIS